MSATKAVKIPQPGGVNCTPALAAPGAVMTTASSQSSASSPPASASTMAPRESAPPLSISCMAFQTAKERGSRRWKRPWNWPSAAACIEGALEKRSRASAGSRLTSALHRSSSIAIKSTRPALVSRPRTPGTLETPKRRTASVGSGVLGPASSICRTRRIRNGRRVMRSSSSSSGSGTEASRSPMRRTMLPASTPARCAAPPAMTSVTTGGRLHSIAMPRGPSPNSTSRASESASRQSACSATALSAATRSPKTRA
mmetsp:Transcript_7156/g.18327  ORF Transcript_7156/g.18327 Transcript_7156/m.18327 type:complete len:256 (+) Transcript_7156:320-1087(+)